MRPPLVALGDKVVNAKRTRAVAQACLALLYSPEGQDLAGTNRFRPIDPRAAAKFAKQHPKVAMFTIDELFGGWANAQKAHFADGGRFDKVSPRKCVCNAGRLAYLIFN